MKLRHAALVVLLTLTPSLAFADADRKAARKEMRAKMVERFDADGDGKLTGAERKQARKAAKRLRRAHKMMKKLARFDANGDGWVTDDELLSGRARKP